MLQINEIKLRLQEETREIPGKIEKKLRLKKGRVSWWEIAGESVDARNKPDIRRVYRVRFRAENEEEILRRAKGLKIPVSRVEPSRKEKWIFSERVLEEDQTQEGNDQRPRLLHRPLVVGFGPCGIFAALVLARAGYRPLVLERGRPMDQRIRDVEAFWETGRLLPQSNVQFGEGGAGAFSDGKLTTGIKKDQRVQWILQALVKAGAPEEILYRQKPHIGTDLLREVVVRLRQRIIDEGGEIRFESRLTDLDFQGREGGLSEIEINEKERLSCQALILAVGHSARDTFSLLYERQLPMEQKPFSIGVRIEHLQEMIDESQYADREAARILGAADYRLSYHCGNGRGVYTFCMCPGGYVVASASEEGGLVTNGMSYHGRDGRNANSALLVGVGPEDFPGEHPLAGVAYQRKWEQAAFRLGGGGYRAPAQRLGDFMKEDPSEYRTIQTETGPEPTYRPGVSWTDLSRCLPREVVAAMKEAIPVFGKRLRGFDREDSILTGVETRSSSPVRILRDPQSLESWRQGVYPAGEGAGYAGGILSAAADGIRAAEALMKKWAPPKTR